MVQAEYKGKPNVNRSKLFKMSAVATSRNTNNKVFHIKAKNFNLKTVQNEFASSNGHTDEQATSKNFATVD